MGRAGRDRLYRGWQGAVARIRSGE
jgi:hypothetical protein